MKTWLELSNSCARFLIGIMFVSLALSGCDKMDPLLQSLKKATKSGPIVPSKELIYQTASAELTLAQSPKPYLVFNFPDSSLDVKVKGALVQRIKLDPVEGDRGAIRDFIRHFAGSNSQLVRPLAGKYLFAAEKQTPDSILKIVSDVTMFESELLQRQIPHRFRVFWDDKLLLDIISDSVEAKQATNVQSKIEKAMMEARYVLRRPFGATLLVLKVQPEEAMTLFRLAEPGAPVMLKLVSTDQLPPPPPAESKKKKK